jgi:hypothetical protein
LYFLNSLAGMQRIVFLGFSYSDPFIKQVIRQCSSNLWLDGRPMHYLVDGVTSILLFASGIALIGLARLRRFNRVPLTGLAMFSFIAVGMASASADPVDVPNASFETSSSGGGWTYNNPGTISDWTVTAPTGSAYGQLWLGFFNSPGTSSGSECAFIDNTSPDQEAFLTSSASLGTIAVDTTYTLTVAVGNADLNNPSMEQGPIVFDPIADTPPAGVSLALLADGEPFAIDPIPAGLVANGSWQNFSFSYTTTATDPIVGDQLTIQLGTEPGSGETESSGSQIHRDRSRV